ncbi:unnamed protein product, partial [Iphiclides podalirius]
MFKPGKSVLDRDTTPKEVGGKKKLARRRGDIAGLIKRQLKRKTGGKTAAGERTRRGDHLIKPKRQRIDQSRDFTTGNHSTDKVIRGGRGAAHRRRFNFAPPRGDRVSSNLFDGAG